MKTVASLDNDTNGHQMRRQKHDDVFNSRFPNIKSQSRLLNSSQPIKDGLYPGSQDIYNTGTQLLFHKLKTSYAKTNDVNHPETKSIEKEYLNSLSVNEASKYIHHKPVLQGSLSQKEIRNQDSISLRLNDNVMSVEDKVFVNQKEQNDLSQDQLLTKIQPESKTFETQSPSQEIDKNDSLKSSVQNNNTQFHKVVDNDESDTETDKIYTQKPENKETKITIPDNILPVVTPRLDKAVDSEKVEIEPDQQTLMNLIGLVATAQKFRDQAVKARSQAKFHNEAGRVIKNKIKNTEQLIQKSDKELHRSELNLKTKENGIKYLEIGLQTSLSRQLIVEKGISIYKKEYNDNKTKASDLNKEAKNLVGGSEKHQDPKNADSGKLKQKLNELSTNAAVINQAIIESGNTIQKLTQESQEAKNKNAIITNQTVSAKNVILESKNKLQSDFKKNAKAKNEITKLTPDLKIAETDCQQFSKQADTLLLDSYIIEDEVVKTQEDYYVDMASVEGKKSLTQKENERIQQQQAELDEAEKLLIHFINLNSEDDQKIFINQLTDSQLNALKDKFEQINSSYDNDKKDRQTLIDQNVVSIRNAQIDVFENKRKDALKKPMNIVTKNLNKISGFNKLWIAISTIFSKMLNDVFSITWADVAKFLLPSLNPKEWFDTFVESITGIWNDVANWRGFSKDPIGMMLSKAAGISNKVLTIAGVITGILGVLTVAAAVGSFFTLGGMAPLAAWLGSATVTMGTVTFWIGAVSLGLNILNGMKNIYDISTAKTAEVLFENSTELKDDIVNSGKAVKAIIDSKSSKKDGAELKKMAKENPKTFGKRKYINLRNSTKAKILSIPRKVTSLFRKETWIKSFQSFKAVYKNAKDWVVEPFKKKSTTPPSRNFNQLPFEEQTVPDRMHEQPLQGKNEKINNKKVEAETTKDDIFGKNSENKKEPELVIYENRIILEDGAPALPDTPSSSFMGAKYKGSKLRNDKIYYRAGESGKPLGQYFSEESPMGVLQVRIDKAILPVWPTGDKSIINMAYKIKIPAGTFIYEGEIAGQGGVYLGGTKQIFISEPWKISGIEVLESYPLK